QPWRASSRVCAASISSVTANTLANAVCDPVQDTRAGSPVRCVVLHEARPGAAAGTTNTARLRSEEHTSELQSRSDLVCRLLLESPRPPPAPHSFPTRRSSDLQPWRASSRVCAASISSVTANTLANAVCDPVQDTRAGSPVRCVVLHEARPGAAAGTTNTARLSTAGPRAGRTRIATDARNRFGVPYTSATARKPGVLRAFWAADGVSHPPSPASTVSTTAIRDMPRRGGQGGATRASRGVTLHCDWGHGHSTASRRVSQTPDFVVEL